MLDTPRSQLFAPSNIAARAACSSSFRRSSRPSCARPESLPRHRATPTTAFDTSAASLTPVALIMFSRNGLIVDNPPWKGLRAAQRRDPSASRKRPSAPSKRDHPTCLRAKQPNRSDPETGYRGDFVEAANLAASRTLCPVARGEGWVFKEFRGWRTCNGKVEIIPKMWFMLVGQAVKQNKYSNLTGNF